MKILINKITSYLNYLNKDCRLSISVHFDKNVFDCLPTQIVAQLLPFNSHINPYCTVVKATNHNKCLQEQKDLLTKCQKDDFLCRICHAGVYEYIYPIIKGTDTAGFIAVSGVCSAILKILSLLYERENHRKSPSVTVAM